DRRGLTLLFIAHDLSVVEYLCDEVVVLYLGRVAERGSGQSVYARPGHPYTRALLSAAPVADPTVHRQREMLTGDIPSPLDPPSGCVFRTRCHYAIDKCAEVTPPPVALAPGHDAACIRIGEF
ncbi:MAG TPA: ABC transporter ATP-binding protein, partial [Reyranella sp.]